MNSRRFQSSEVSQTSVPLRREGRQRLQITTPDNRPRRDYPSETDGILKYSRQRNSQTKFRISSKHSNNIPGIKPLFISLKDQTKHLSQYMSKLSQSYVQEKQEEPEHSTKRVEDYLVINQFIESKSPKTSLVKRQRLTHTRQEKQDNEGKLEFNLRIQIPNVNESVDTLMSYYNRKMKYQQDIKVFVFNSKDDYIRRVLVHWGWVQNKILESPFYHLKWTYMDTSNDHKSIQGQILNHFKNNQEMTSKGGLMKNLRNYAGFQLKLEQFMPRSYDLTIPSDADCFYYEYQRSTMMAILKKHYKYFLDKLPPPLFQTLVKQVEQSMMRQKRRWRNKKYQYKPGARKNVFELGKYEEKEDPREDLVVNTQVLIMCVRYWRYQKKCEEDEDWGNPSGFLSYNKQEFIKGFPSILKYSRLNPPYQSEQGNSNYSTPSHKLIKKLLKYFFYFKSKNPHTWSSDGDSNVWVIKPANNARGNGIFLQNDCYQIINSSQGHNRIVQKYIENPLICTSPQYPLLFSKKFDIRQWVLVTSFNPLNAWMFSSCYLRICSEPYDINDIKMLQKHLTNYSFNKSNFNKKQESIESLENFKIYLEDQHSVSWDVRIKPQIQQIIFNTLLTCSDNILDSPNRFQLYGFDILIDQQFNPWLLEVNLSPACEERTEFLKEYCQCMGEQLLRIVLPSVYCQERPLNSNQRSYQWQKLPHNFFEEKRREDIQVSGTKINLKYQKKVQRLYGENDAAVKIQSVMRMAKPKNQLKQLKRLFFSKSFEKYARFMLAKKQHTNRITQLVFQRVENILQTTVTLQSYQQKLTQYNHRRIEAYVKVVNPLAEFKRKRLSLAVRSIQSIYQHYQCLEIIITHKHTASIIKKIQRWYRGHYKEKVRASNIIKKALRDHIYEKKQKQFLHQLQVYTNRIVLQKYLVSFGLGVGLERLREKRNTSLIQNSVRQFFDIQRLMKKKLSIFDREVGRVMRVNIRRTRVCYLPLIKEYVEQKIRISLQLSRYLGGLLEVGSFKRKKRRQKLRVLSRYLRGVLVMKGFSKRKSERDEREEEENSELSSRKQLEGNAHPNIKAIKCPPISSFLQDREGRDSRHKPCSTRKESIKPRQKIPLIHIKHQEQERLTKYISKIKEIRTVNSRNTNKKY